MAIKPQVTPLIIDNYRNACLGYSEATGRRFPAMKTKTVAVDFDGTLSKLTPDAGDMGELMPWAKEALDIFRSQEWQIIIYTARPEPHRVMAFLEDNDVAFDSINVNQIDVAMTGVATPKPFAHLYIDDRAYPMCGIFVGWPKIISDLTQMRILDNDWRTDMEISTKALKEILGHQEYA